jgi:hypothetical protein
MYVQCLCEVRLVLAAKAVSLAELICLLCSLCTRVQHRVDELFGGMPAVERSQAIVVNEVRVKVWLHTC